MINKGLILFLLKIKYPKSSFASVYINTKIKKIKKCNIDAAQKSFQTNNNEIINALATWSSVKMLTLSICLACEHQFCDRTHTSESWSVVSCAELISI